MLVKDGQTLVLGGLIKDDKQVQVAKVPFLGDIPLIKYAFRNEYTTTVKKEIVIFITPRVMSPEKKIVAAEVPVVEKAAVVEKQDKRDEIMANSLATQQTKAKPAKSKKK
jgi:type II secretory pathway component GspD/PulD (secretin)